MQKLHSDYFLCNFLYFLNFYEYLFISYIKKTTKVTINGSTYIYFKRSFNEINP